MGVRSTKEKWNAYQRQWRKNNPEKHKSYRNREKVRAQVARYLQRHPEKKRQHQQALTRRQIDELRWLLESDGQGRKGQRCKVRKGGALNSRRARRFKLRGAPSDDSRRKHGHFGHRFQTVATNDTRWHDAQREGVDRVQKEMKKTADFLESCEAIVIWQPHNKDHNIATLLSLAFACKAGCRRTGYALTIGIGKAFVQFWGVN